MLVRSDLDTTYRGVQGIHAVAAFYERGNNSEWHNQTLVQLAIRNEQELRHWAWKLDVHKKNWTGFFEPDLNNQLTAIACVDTGEIFKNLQLSRN
ncbi:MAG: hypothetical protein Q7R33_04880 [Nitrosarchaeum sp.]|nr:hypothetical protein [Nitrosarchaeum sp.]